MQVRDAYAYWRELVDGVPGGEIPQEPQAGFWRRRMGKGGPWRPVAIWPGEDGELRCLDGSDEVEPWRFWDFVCVNPTTEAAYRAKVAGTPYSDEYRVRGSVSDDDLTTDVARAAAIGPPIRRHNGNQQETDGGGA